MDVPVHLAPSMVPSGAQGIAAMGYQDTWGSGADEDEGMDMFALGSARAETPQLAFHLGIRAPAALVWLQGPFHPECPDPHGHYPDRWICVCASHWQGKDQTQVPHLSLG